MVLQRKYQKNIDIIEEDFKSIINGLSLNFYLKEISDKSILITGASGFIGSYLVEFLLYLNTVHNANININCLVRSKIALVKKSFSEDISNHVNIIQQDLCSHEITKLPKFDICLYCASNASPLHYHSDPIGTLKPNLIGLINVLEQTSKSAKFLYLSSGEVYGVVKQGEINEKNYGYLDPLELRSCYGESKRMGENICKSYSHQRKIDVRIVRPFHTYGPGLSSKDGRVFADFIHAAAKEENIVLTSNGDACRPFCYISDLISSFFYILFQGMNGEAYNISNPSANISILKLAEKICSLNSNNKSKIIFKSASDSYMKSPIQNQLVSIKKANALGWQPNIDINYGFRRSIEFERNKYLANA